MRWPDYVAVFQFSPKIFFNFIFEESFFNPKVIYYLLKIKSNYSKNIKDFHTLSEQNIYPALTPKLEYDSNYESCHYKYFSRVHFINDVALDEHYLTKLKDYIATKIDTKVVYYFPEINKGNYALTKSTIATINQYFKPLNRFVQSEYPNNMMFDQWYHLNSCGAELNTNQFIENIKPYLENH
jgi:hypothetical protein